MVALSSVDENNYQRILQYNNSIEDVKSRMVDNSDNAKRRYEQYDEQTRIVHTPKQQQQKRLTKDEIKQIISGYQNGATVYELAAQLGRHRNTISKVLKRNGIRPTIELDIDIQTITTLYNNGCKIADIAQRFNVSDEAIRRRLLENGVKMRTRGDYA
jgi:predicted transcriptional regulator